MATDTCIACGKPKGSNPKFCSRSCAARHNNSTTPKRRPGERCERCGNAMPKGKRYCPECRVIVDGETERAERRKQLNLRTWRTPLGDQVEAPIRRVHFEREVVFSSSHLRLRKGLSRSHLPGPRWNQPGRFFEIIDPDEILLCNRHRAHQGSTNNRLCAALLARHPGLERAVAKSLRLMLVCVAQAAGTPQRGFSKTIRDLIDCCVELFLLLVLALIK
jgi:hypothetical protein